MLEGNRRCPATDGNARGCKCASTGVPEVSMALPNRQYADISSYFAGNKPLIEESVFRNSSLQAAYFILAARALGLDCGPMSGFDADKLNAAFFPDGKWKVNLLCNLGYG